MRQIFSYGTLQLPNVQTVLWGAPKAPLTITSIRGYVVKIAFIAGGNFPVLVADKDGVVYGSIFSLNKQELAMTDKYETADYTRKRVRCENGLLADVYIPKK